MTHSNALERKLGFVLCFILALNFVGCSSFTKHDQLPELDLSLVKPDTTEYRTPFPMTSPYVVKFEAHDKILLYAAVKHASSRDYPNLFDDPTFKTVSQLFKDYQIGAVVVEGIPGQGSWREGEVPASLVKRCDQCEKDNYEKCGEPYFAIQQGRKSHAKIFRGEPSEPEVIAEITKEGFTIKDLLGFYIVRMIPTWKISNEFDSASAKGLIEKRILFEKRQIGTNIEFDYAQFVTWYKVHMSKPASFMDIEMSDTGEVTARDNTFIQNISHAIGIVRDQSIALQIRKALEEVSTVLVVYGSSHYLNSRNALERMM
jgi:hypothetical protein